ncbi:hypothetical protein BT96DRAFT_64 [Gymnopus androsaceus JB14]|uniref:Uncharacterized protein n=1 Tax=Gymnopus androsaceus JB14 TaxID=1447944 RepID=A0A6A4IFP3_9AGAR|nr:hypothetical protein BT96DRAFT_64 [Gymnopus androsaceus JB14]
MLARPKPPAQVRRASKESSSKLVFPSEDDTDLPELLIRADGLIRERERELSFTSEFSRELKQTHEALVARTPLTSPSPFLTPLPLSPRNISTFSNTSTQFQKLHALHSGQIPSAQSRFGQVRHTRRISITQSELARLSDQNAELLQKLEQLEEESTLADKAGRRRLSKLENEIQTLRTELDEARQDASQRSKEEKRTALRARRKRDEETKSSSTFQDFAPSSSTSSLSLSHSSSSSSLKSEPSEPSSLILSHLLSKISELEEANVQICREQHETSGRLRVAQSEVEGMRKVWSYLGMGPGPGNDNEDPIDVEIVDEYHDLDEEGQGTVRFRSLRQNMLSSLASATSATDISGSSTLSQAGSINSLRSLDFDEGIGGEMHSTLRSTSRLGSQPFGRSVKGNGKGRKSVVGLFGGGEEISSDSLNLDVVQSPFSPSPANRKVLDPMFSPSGELSELDISILHEHSRPFDAFSDDEASPQSELGLGSRRRTLGSEIGDFGHLNDPLSPQDCQNSLLVQELEGSFDKEALDAHLLPDNGDEETQKYQLAFPPSASIRITPPTPVKNGTFSTTSFSESSTTSPTTSVFSPFPSTPELSSSSSVDVSPVQSPSKAESARARRISLSQSVKARAGRWGPRLDNIFGSDQAKPDSISGFGIRQGLSSKFSEGLGSIFGNQAISGAGKEQEPKMKSRPSLGFRSSSASSGRAPVPLSSESISPGNDTSSGSNFTSNPNVIPSKTSTKSERNRRLPRPIPAHLFVPPFQRRARALAHARSVAMATTPIGVGRVHMGCSKKGSEGYTEY